MDKQAQQYLNLFRTIREVSAATKDRDGHLHSRIITIMDVTEEGMIIITSRGKPYWQQLMDSREISLGAVLQPWQGLNFTGKVRPVDDLKRGIDLVYEKNPFMEDIYPGSTRYVLDTFIIYEGVGEYFDLRQRPARREVFSYGGAKRPAVGFHITSRCIGCGHCAKRCPQSCITQGTPYHITWENCLQCGLCAEECPAKAIERLHP